MSARADLRAKMRACAFDGARAIAPPFLTPFEIVLDLLGETIGPRLLFVRANNHDAEDGAVCLRPDLTLPAALAFAAAPEHAEPHIAAYDGPAFRLGLETRAPEEFFQIGREIFNGTGDLAEDLDLFARAIACATAGGARKIRVRVSDMALLSALIADAPMSADWRGRFVRRLGRPKALADLLAAGIEPGTGETPAAVVRTSAEARAALAVQAGAPLAGRLAEEIVARAAARGANDPLPRDIAAMLRAFFALRGAPAAILTEAETLGPKGLKFTEALGRIRAFCAGAAQILDIAGLAESDLIFSAETGGAFDYYDGVVFAIDAAFADDGAYSRIGAGGRYDRLIERLSHGARRARAAGFALRPDRLGLAGAEGGQ